MRNFVLQELIAREGEKAQGFLKVCGTDLYLPTTIICGAEPGNTVLISGGIHNAEFVGIETAIELATELSPEEINGNIVIVHLANRSGFEHRTMSLVYEDEKNLNREFPARYDGTLAEQICHFIETELFLQADFYIDLHCGDNFEALTPFVYCQGNAAPAIAEKSLEMGQWVDVPYLVISASNRGGAYNYAGAIGIPGILVERGCSGLWSPQEVNAYKKDICNILRGIGSLTGAAERPGRKTIFRKTVYALSPATGCWYPHYTPGTTIKKGQKLGVIKDYFGQELATYIAEENGVILYETISLNIRKDDPLIAYGVLTAP